MTSGPAGLPAGFSSLSAVSEAQKFAIINVMGVVTRIWEPSKCGGKGKDWQLKVSLKHPSFDQERECKWFNNETHLPDIKNIGDVVLIRKAKVTVRDMPILVCFSDNKKTIVFRANFLHSIPGQGQVNFLRILGTVECPSSEEQLHAGFLQQWAIANTNLPSAQPPVSHQPVNRRLALLQNVTADRYYDVVGEVVKLFNRPGYSSTDMYLTDYTTNNLFFPYTTTDAGQPDLDGSHDPNYFTQKREWPGPWGKMSVQITLWSPNSEFANSNVSVGDFVYLRNMHVKYNEKYLEGSCFTDKRYPEKVAITILKETDSLCAALIKRKRAYSSQARGSVPATESKAQRKKRLKKENHDKQRALELRERIKTRDVEMAVIPRQRIGDQPSDTQKSGSNPNVVAGHKDIQPQSLYSILHSPHLEGTTINGMEIVYPFINMNVRAQVRVVDFFPSKLEDFAHCLDDHKYNDQPSRLDRDDDETFIDNTPGNRWEWGFWLLLEDAKEVPGQETARMKVLVAGQDAEYLLKLDASNLRRDIATLHGLREKMRALWGDLEDIKREGNLKPPESKTFECCIQEFGISDRADGWIRMHRMFKTTIR